MALSLHALTLPPLETARPPHEAHCPAPRTTNTCRLHLCSCCPKTEHGQSCLHVPSSQPSRRARPPLISNHWPPFVAEFWKSHKLNLRRAVPLLLLPSLATKPTNSSYALFLYISYHPFFLRGSASFVFVG
ncbi:uncharacterized protein LOC122280038 [Carya illinoinensis]|uniref:uncharacterized protein LOC122280038 n=1 Tax=Carya illinoinensis TaxID=32201 RepID=UPI001C71BA79|nr:uncharacterized protein LOC122280038 [Carya illinoinensis]